MQKLMSVIQHVVCIVIVSVTMKSECELVGDAVFGTNLHLSEEYITADLRWLSIEVHMVTIFVPPSTLEISCTVFVTILPDIIVIIWSAKLVSIVVL